ncbi:MAG: hypothetical protein ACUVTR_02205 [Dehalococcoidia bacterium]
MEEGFATDGITKRTVIGIAECLLTPGEINLSWNDTSNVLLQDGQTMIAFGCGTGKGRAMEACDNALSDCRTASRTTKKPVRSLFRLIGPRDLLLKKR